MGLFKRNGDASGRSGKPRPSVSSEAQAAELRGRARRRLAGAVALVVAAVIVLPMVLDSEPVPVSDDIPIRIPDRNAPYDPTLTTPSAQSGALAADASGRDDGVTPREPLLAPPSVAMVTPGVAPAPDHADLPEAVPAPTPTPTPPPKPTPPPRTPAKPEPRVESKPEPRTPKPEARSDDGARAMALLEGRPAAPAKPAPAAAPNGNFVLQIASYTASGDAQGRRDKLHAAGVTNAFVEQANIGGKQQFRLRVGPFPSRDAAQAAQARLRTLGYDNGFIAAQ